MSTLFDNNPALYGSIMFYGAGMLPRLRAMTFNDLKAMADQANQRSMEFPLHLAGSKDRFEVPLWSEEKLSGAQVISLLVFSLWCLCGESEELAAPLLNAWPIREAVMLCPKPAAQEPQYENQKD